MKVNTITMIMILLASVTHIGILCIMEAGEEVVSIHVQVLLAQDGITNLVEDRSR